jgi:hypothetical protein
VNPPGLTKGLLESQHSVAAALAAVFFVALITTPPAKAQTESVLYTFCSAANCADGRIRSISEMAIY